MALTDQDIIDLGLSTQEKLGRMKFTEIATELPNYEILSKVMKKERVIEDGGESIRRNLMVDTSGNAKMVGLYEPDAVNVADVLAKINVPWKHGYTAYAWERRELLMNGGPAKIVDLIKVRRTDAMISWAELVETQAWEAPSDADDNLHVFGIPYWIVKNATDGFTGAEPACASTTGVGGALTSTYPRWKNYAYTYDAVTKASLITKMRRMARQTNFKSPVDVPDYRRGLGQRYRHYMNQNTIESMEALGEAQNENLGRDLAPMDGSITFKRQPLVYVPALDADTANPIYSINWAVFHCVFLKGDVMRESKPQVSKDSHNTFVVFVDTTYNFLCSNRRLCAVGYKV